MNILTLRKRLSTAQQRVIKAAEKLVERRGLDAKLVDALRVQSGEPIVRLAAEREAVADLLEALVQSKRDWFGLDKGEDKAAGGEKLEKAADEEGKGKKKDKATG